MTTHQMLLAISHSDNEICADKAKAILNGETTIEHELKYSGSFMTAVMKGDFKRAMECADMSNRIALSQYKLDKMLFTD